MSGLPLRGAVLLVLLLIGGCDRRWLRDDYMGKSWLQPELTPQPVVRDSRGDPVLPSAPPPAAPK